MHKKLFVLATLLVTDINHGTAQSTILPEWTWMHGLSITSQNGTYGTQGVPAATNIPGSRYVVGGHWTDFAGNIWMTGGLGYAGVGGTGSTNDLWKFDTLTRQWVWVKGSNAVNAAGTYGTQGVPAVTNEPGSRYSSNMCWKDTAGNFWMFGGQTTNYRNDLCKYNPVTNEWTWVSGSGTAFNQFGVYGTQGTPSAATHPGSRSGGAAWTDAAGNFWLFSGYGYGASGGLGYLNDMWKYTPATGQWTWIGGPNTPAAAGNYGTRGVAATTNIPPGRVSSGFWVDNAGNFWLFGGINSGILNDLWKYDPVANLWTWMHGTSTGNPFGTYGTLYVPDPANTPGGRYTVSNWKDADGNLWLFGGNGFAASGARTYLNDLWKYDIATNEWRWVTGVSSGLGYAVYGTLGMPTPGNTPGARQTSWTDWVANDGSFWLFGGNGHVASGSNGYLNDMWRFRISCNVDLGPDTAFCSGEQYVLNPGFPGMPRVWSTGATSDTLIVTTGGTYWCSMNMPCGWQTDTVEIYVYPKPVVDLGTDVHECEGTPVSLSSTITNPGMRHLWNTGDTIPTLPVTQAGQYWLQVGRSGCTGADTINVLFDKKLELDLGADTGICTRDLPLILYAGQPSGTRHLWNNGSTQDSLTITHSGTYWLAVTRDLCDASDTIHVEVVPTPVIHIGPDSIICEQFPLYMGVEVSGASYTWNTGAATSHIYVDRTGTYMLEVNLRGCRVWDTINITAMPVPEIDLGEDGDICPEQTIVLDGSYGSNSRYIWSTGDTTASVAVTSADRYSVTVTTEHKCIGSDTIILSYYPKPTVSLGRDTTVCEETPLILSAWMINTDSVAWSDGSYGNSLTVRYGGEYIATGINKCGTGSDTIVVKQIFCDIWVPNAFTPNGDGVNDVFRILGNLGRLEGVSLSVYNRWGEQIFYSEDKYKGWDGMHKGSPALQGTYVYLLQYSLDARPYQQQGSFHLLR